jgi:hypothetical protein
MTITQCKTMRLLGYNRRLSKGPNYEEERNGEKMQILMTLIGSLSIVCKYHFSVPCKYIQSLRVNRETNINSKKENCICDHKLLYWKQSISIQVTLSLETLVGLAQSNSCQAQCSQCMGKRLATEPGHSPVLRNTASTLPPHSPAWTLRIVQLKTTGEETFPTTGWLLVQILMQKLRKYEEKKWDHLTHPKLHIYRVTNTNTINKKKRKYVTKNVFNLIFIFLWFWIGVHCRVTIVLAIYQIYHTWIHILHHCVFQPLPHTFWK